MFCLLSFPQSILLAASSLCIFQEAIWMHNKARKISFIFSQWIFLYRCHLLNVFHPKCPIRPRGYTLLKTCSHILSFCFITNMVNMSENTGFVSLLLDGCHIGSH